jgi:DNA-binding NarL/FixJ family response regulator
MRVLIVEDSIMIKVRLFDRLNSIPGVQVCGVEITASEALETIASRKPDLVLLDIGLETGSGIDVLKGLNDIQYRPRVFMLSNEDPAQFEAPCLALGAEQYFDKYGQFEECMETLRQIADESHAHPKARSFAEYALAGA